MHVDLCRRLQSAQRCGVRRLVNARRERRRLLHGHYLVASGEIAACSGCCSLRDGDRPADPDVALEESGGGRSTVTCHASIVQLGEPEVSGLIRGLGRAAYSS